jgi:glutamine synthetase
MITDRSPLTNPLALLLEKPRAEFTRKDLLRVITERSIERITFHYTGLDGKLKELKIPLGGMAQAERILADGERVDGSSLFKGMVDASLSDLYVVPSYASAFLNPFDPGSLDFLCRYITNDGRLAPFAPDTILRNAAERFLARTGYELHAMGELEFFLLGDPASRTYAAARQRGYHASAPFVKSGPILDEMVHAISIITGSVKYAHSEVGYVESVRSDLEEIRGKSAEQLEIEFLPAPVGEAADALVLARWVIRNIAYRHNCVATFTPKLEEGIAGNGMHIHMELRKSDRNMMTDASGKLTSDARKLIGGLCAYADTLTAFGNTVSSAYLRLVPNQEAPTRICWSDQNRSAMIRVPLGWSRASNLARIVNPQQTEDFQRQAGLQTVELRSPDGSAMVHLLLAGIVRAAEYGLTDPGSESRATQLYVSGNIFKDEALLRSLSSLPKSCVESAHILREKREMYERDGIFPPSIIDYMASLLEAEDDENINARLADLPADDRLLETRKIMHKDLHRH